MDSTQSDPEAAPPGNEGSSVVVCAASDAHPSVSPAKEAATKLGSWSLNKSKVKKLGIKSSLLLALTKMTKSGKLGVKLVVVSFFVV